jgi:hypothetical protein
LHTPLSSGPGLALTSFLASVILIITLSPFNSFAFDKWSKQDIILESIWLGLNLLDWGQTLYIADHPQNYYERNSLFSDHPDRGRVNFLFALGIPLHIGITHLLPAKWRPYYQGVTISITGYCVINNFQAGIGFAF